MKEKFVSSLLLILIVLFCGCSNSSEEDIALKATYYVKYSFKCGNSLYYCSFTANYMDEKLQMRSRSYGKYVPASEGKKSYSDEIVCGPFKYGDHVVLTITDHMNITNSIVEISVSENNSPFALKASGNRSVFYDIK